MSPPQRVIGTLRMVGTRRKTCQCTRYSHDNLRTSRPLSSKCRNNLAILHETCELAPRLSHLNGREAPPYISTRFNALTRAEEHIEASDSSSKIRVVVYSPDSGVSSALVTALLCDPLSSDNEQQLNIRQRWENIERRSQRDPLTFDFQPQYSQNIDENRFHVTSPWLSQRPIDLVELPPSSPLNSENAARILSADVVVVVINPMASLHDEIWENLRSLQHPNTIIVVNATAGTSTLETTTKEIGNKLGSVPPHLVFANIDQALHALDTLQKSPTSPSAIQDYQTSVSNSQILDLTHTIDSLVEKHNASPNRDGIAHSLTTNAINTARASLSAIEEDVSSTRSLISDLRDRVDTEGNVTVKHILGPSTIYEALQRGTEEFSEADYGTIYDLHTKAGKTVKVTMDKLRWWKLPVVADEVSYRVSVAVEAAYRANVERHLVFHAGRLSSLQHTFLSLTYSQLITKLPPTLVSPLLSNTLAQLSTNPSFRISPTQLLTPALARLSTLSASTIRLHKSATRLVLSTGASALSSAMFSAYLFVSSFIDMATALGITSLVSIGFLRWAVGRWERAKGWWWDDWNRVGKAVERDLREEVRQCLANQVFIVPIKACDGAEDLAKKREGDCEDIKTRLDELEQKLNENGEKKI